jgi:hypothetical protein
MAHADPARDVHVPVREVGPFPAGFSGQAEEPRYTLRCHVDVERLFARLSPALHSDA